MYELKSSYLNKIACCSILLIACVFCFNNISLRPLHVDESVNGFFVTQIWENGFYTYDPGNYHGPLAFYLFQISEKIFGFGVHSFRILSAVFLFLTVLFILRNRIVLGKYACLFIAIATALSPGMIYFRRSSIHESAFVFFQILMITGFLKARENMSRQGLLWFFAGFLGAILLKETFVILGVAFALAWLWLEISPGMINWIKIKDDLPKRPEFGKTEKVFFLKISFIVVVVWLVFYTGFFHHWKGASDFFIALMPWFKTGVKGSGHDKPFFYWIRLMSRYEWVALIGVIAACAGIVSRSWKIRFLSALALVNGFIYSYIPYKTPWCIVSILWPFVFVAGLWFEFISVKLQPKKTFAFIVSVSLTSVVLIHSAVMAYIINFKNYEDTSEPYVYVQTRNDFKIIGNIIQKRTESSPDFHNTPVLIKLNDTWPFPWFLSRFPHVRYGDHREATKRGEDIIFSETTADDRDLAGLYWRRLINVREARVPIYVYLKISAFDGMVLPGFSIVQGQGTKVF